MTTTSFDFVAHPLAGMFPMIEGPEAENLRADIAKHGIHQPIVLFQGMILDGRNRYAAAKAGGRVFSAADFTEFVGSTAQAEAFVISTNFHRRQLTTAQKQEVIQGMIRKNPALGDREIARLCGVSHSTVGTARDRLTNSPEARRYEQFKRAWKALSDDQSRTFVREHVADLRFLLHEVAVESTS